MVKEGVTVEEVVLEEINARGYPRIDLQQSYSIPRNKKLLDEVDILVKFINVKGYIENSHLDRSRYFFTTITLF